MKRRPPALSLSAGLLLSLVALTTWGQPVEKSTPLPVTNQTTNSAPARKTVADRLTEFGAAARARMKPGFDQAGVSYPPAQVRLLAIKAERVMEVYAPDGKGAWRRVLRYPILAASGGPGPKLREGDHQVPEGIYALEAFNPNSSYHVSLRVGYPNTFDRAMAAGEGRINLGGDIMIHGRNISVGCLAMGDPVSEEIFTLAADTGLEHIEVIITPVDFRAGKTVPDTAKLPPWSDQLYPQIKSELAQLPLEKSE